MGSILVIMGEPVIMHMGPFDLPGNGRGALCSQDRANIMQMAQCSAAVQAKARWGRKRKLTISGPPEFGKVL